MLPNNMGSIFYGYPLQYNAQPQSGLSLQAFVPQGFTLYPAAFRQ